MRHSADHGFSSRTEPPQREAVAKTEGPLLILAGAGSGKTRVITHRVATLCRISACRLRVLAVTFTNKAAEEMRNRVTSLLDGVELSSAPNVFTFHSFCVRLLRRDGEALAQIRPGFKRNFIIYDQEDQVALIKSAYRHLGLDEEFMKHRVALAKIGDAKADKRTPQDMYRSVDHITSKLASVYEEYEKALRQANALDFDDLLLETVRLLAHDEATRNVYNRRFSYLMIDEYQDTNRAQYELMRLLTASTRTSAWWATKISPSTAGAARTSAIFSISKRIIPARAPFASSRTIARLSAFSRPPARWLRTIWNARQDAVDRFGAGEAITIYAGYDAENEALFIADAIERMLAQNPGDAWRCCIAPTRSRGRLRRRCAGTGGSTW